LHVALRRRANPFKVRGFLQDIPLQIAALRRYIEAGDRNGSERQAHTIKGAAGNVGGNLLRDVAFEMEKAAKAGDLRSAGEYMADLDVQFVRLKDAITREI